MVELSFRVIQSSDKVPSPALFPPDFSLLIMVTMSDSTSNFFHVRLTSYCFLTAGMRVLDM